MYAGKCNADPVIRVLHWCPFCKILKKHCPAASTSQKKKCTQCSLKKQTPSVTVIADVTTHA